MTDKQKIAKMIWLLELLEDVCKDNGMKVWTNTIGKVLDQMKPERILIRNTQNGDNQKQNKKG